MVGINMDANLSATLLAGKSSLDVVSAPSPIRSLSILALAEQEVPIKEVIPNIGGFATASMGGNTTSQQGRPNMTLL